MSSAWKHQVFCHLSALAWIYSHASVQHSDKDAKKSWMIQSDEWTYVISTEGSILNIYITDCHLFDWWYSISLDSRSNMIAFYESFTAVKENMKRIHPETNIGWLTAFESIIYDYYKTNK